LFLSILIAATLTTLAAQSRTPPLTGTWTLRIESHRGSGTPMIILNQQGAALTGHFSGALFGEADLRGSVNGTSVTFTVFAKWQGEKRDLVFVGHYDGRATISGSYSNDFGDGIFKATRK
jgi:hypothetical protein